MKSLNDRLLESSSSVNKALEALENSAKDIFNAYIKVHKPTDTLKDAADYIYKAVIDVITSVGKNDISVDEIKEISNQYYKEITDNLKSEGFKMTDKFDDYLRTINSITEDSGYSKGGIFACAICLALILGSVGWCAWYENSTEAGRVEKAQREKARKEWVQKRKEEKKDDFETLSNWQREYNQRVRIQQQQMRMRQSNRH